MDENFDIVTGEQLKKARGGWHRSQPKLDPENVPEPLRHLVSAAEKWGISDDVLRENLLTNAPRGELERVAVELQRVETVLDQWLAGPEANAEAPSREYIAFSALRMLVLSL